MTLLQPSITSVEESLDRRMASSDSASAIALQSWLVHVRESRTADDWDEHNSDVSSSYLAAFMAGQAMFTDEPDTPGDQFVATSLMPLTDPSHEAEESFSAADNDEFGEHNERFHAELAFIPAAAFWQQRADRYEQMTTRSHDEENALRRARYRLRKPSKWQALAGLMGGLAAAGFNAGVTAAGISEGSGVRSWITQRDQNVRKTHTNADGQCRPYGQSFLVGMANLRFPRDPVGSIKETMNCRCFVYPRESCPEQT